MGPTDNAAPTAGTRPNDHTVTELRLALVCYGGVSLAIYMHGVTKELHKLVAASRRFDELGPAAANPFDSETETEYAYFETLADLARRQQLYSVNIDIVAGTSAGGINGVCLAKAVARNGSQDALTKLWIDEADLTRLLHAWPVGGSRTRATLAASRTLMGLTRPISPLRGERMSRLLYDALSAMETPATPDRRSLLLPATPLDLFVTVTDLDGIQTLVASGTGGISQRETNHAQVVQIRSSGSDDAFGPSSTGALVFASRATSCFPGAFPPVSVISFQRELTRSRQIDPSGVTGAFRNLPIDRDPAHTWFVDGGVLDNAPFDLVIEAIGAKRAQTEVVRRLIYIQPDPGAPLQTPSAAHDAGATDSADSADGAPGYLRALLKGVVSVKGSHAILRDLETLRDLNLRIGELGAITHAQMAQVNTAIDDAWSAGTRGRTQNDIWTADAVDDVKALAEAINSSASAFVGAGYQTYCRLKVEAAGRRLADEVVARFVYPPGSSRSSFVRAAIAAWARGRVEWQQPDTTTLMELLGPVDVPYRERRLMFILAGISELYAGVDRPGSPLRRDHLDQMKTEAWRLLDGLRDAPRVAVSSVTDDQIAFLGVDLSDEATFSSPEAFGQANDAEFQRLFTTYRGSLEHQLADSSVPMWLKFVEQTQGWDTTHRRQLLSRYLGFPLWDALIFPTVALSDLPQFTPITVSQFSPLTALALAPADPDGHKLKGVSLHHFGGFIDAGWRENDYLWGRLDSAELLLRMLATSAPGSPPVTPTSPAQAASIAGRWLGPALHAILASETAMARNPELLKALEPQIAAMMPSAVDR